jgi:hypothetical protein
MVRKFDFLMILAFIAFMAIVITCAIVVTANTYGSVNLRSFNRLHKTHYTMDEWRIYEYDIKKAYPFIPKEAPDGR